MARHPKNKGLSRRSLLQVSTAAAGGLILEQTFLGHSVQAQTADPQFLLLVYFDGGWDQLLALDPRDATLAKYQRPAASNPTTGTGIAPDYPVLAVGDSDMTSLLASKPSGLQRAPGGTVDFGPAIPASFVNNHYADMCVVRGVSMDTLTHQVGMRYFLTGKLPRGLTANGSSLNTVWAERTKSKLDLPNLALDIESYNEGLPAFASPIRISSASDVQRVLTPGTPELLPSTDRALQAWEGTEDSCAAHGYDISGLVGAFRSSRTQSRNLANQQKADLFNFVATPPVGSDLPALYSALNIDTAKLGSELAGPKGQAAVAARAISKGVSTVVALNLVNDLDDHFDAAGEQSVKLRSGFSALGDLITFLKNTPAPGSSKSCWQCTTLMAFSEFARTPLMNSRGGRDHHLASSALLAGPGIVGNLAFGASSEKGMGTMKWNLTSGAADDVTGTYVRPTDLHATLLKSMGFDYSHLSNQSPQLIRKILKP